MCDTFWHLEFHEQDTALFADLARGEGAAALRLALDDRAAPQHPLPRLHASRRATTTSSAPCSASAARPGASPASTATGADAPFDDDDVAVVRAISAVVAGALRVARPRRRIPWLGQAVGARPHRDRP